MGKDRLIKSMIKLEGELFLRKDVIKALVDPEQEHDL